MIRHTDYKRKATTSQPIWSLGYLVGHSLEQALKPACAQLSGRLLDLGCGNSPYRSWLPHVTSYIPYDADLSSAGAEAIGLAHSLPFADKAFDSVLCTQVLEHVEQPWQVLDDVARVLRSDGILVLSVPQAWRIHEAPYDFYRYTRFGIAALLRRSGFELVNCTPQGGAWLLIGQTINNHIWRKKHRRHSAAWLISRALATPVTLVTNIVSKTLDSLFPDGEETLNYVAIARKHRSTQRKP